MAKTLIGLVSAGVLQPSVCGHFKVIDGWNAIPSGDPTTKKTVQDCESACTGACTQFSWNKNSHHCYTSSSSRWAGYALDHVTSGCDPDRVGNCGSAPAPSPPSPQPEHFDGVLRENGKGRLDAYLIPPFKSNHASMIEQEAGGGLSMAWFSGTKEGQDDVSIVFAHLENQSASAGAVWSAAKTVSRREGYSNQNAVLHFDKATSLLHLFHSQQGAGQGESKATVWHLQAPVKGGAIGEFSTPHEVFSKPGSFDKNRVLPLLDGGWLLPLYGQDRSPNYPKNAFLPAGADPDKADSWSVREYGSKCDNMVQPSVVRPKAGAPSLTAFFRDRKKRNIYVSRSEDDGKSWSPCESTVLPNNNAGIEAYAMRSGRIAMVYNPQTTSRDPLAISLSEDGGKSWKYTRTLEHLDGRQEFSYPTLREDISKDGVIHVSYTYKRQCIKHSIISEEWIMSGTSVFV